MSGGLLMRCSIELDSALTVVGLFFSFFFKYNLHIRKRIPAVMKGNSFIIHASVSVAATGQYVNCCYIMKYSIMDFRDVPVIGCWTLGVY